MKNTIIAILITCSLATFYLFANPQENKSKSAAPSPEIQEKIDRIYKIMREDFEKQKLPEVAVTENKKPASYWEDKLSSEAKYVLCEGGTERPFKNAYWDNTSYGLYRGADDEQPLFHSEDKYKSGSGWPSFTRPVSPDVVKLVPDTSHGMERIEVVSASTGGHLGHVFFDGPPPTGLRFCINSAALEFEANAARSADKEK